MYDKWDQLKIFLERISIKWLEFPGKKQEEAEEDDEEEEVEEEEEAFKISPEKKISMEKIYNPSGIFVRNLNISSK